MTDTTQDARALVERLRGKVRIPITDGLGPAGGEEPDNADFFVRSFPTSPLAMEAADALTAALDRAEKAEAVRDDLAMALRAEQETALLSPEIKQALADQSSHAAGYAQGVQAVVDACDMVKVVSVCGSGQVYESGFQAGANRCHEEALALLPADTPALGAAAPAWAWAVDKWHDEVANRPLQNIHRRTLDTTWRQVIRHYGGDDVTLIGPTHDDLLEALAGKQP